MVPASVPTALPLLLPTALPLLLPAMLVLLPAASLKDAAGRNARRPGLRGGCDRGRSAITRVCSLSWWPG